MIACSAPLPPPRGPRSTKKTFIMVIAAVATVEYVRAKQQIKECNGIISKTYEMLRS
jgi:hypothetical protein